MKGFRFACAAPRGALIGLLVALGACHKQKTLTGEALKDPQSCVECHASYVDAWSGTMHAYASDDPVFVAMNKRGQRETNGGLGDFCVKCHAPVAVAAGLTADGSNLAELPAYDRGVTCYFCHSVASVQGAHDDPLVLAGDETLRAAISDPLDNPAHEAGYSPLLDHDQRDSASLCGSCHDIVTQNGLALENTFGEWQNEQFGNGHAGLQTCGQCHMPPMGQRVPAADFPGVQAREVHDHTLAKGVDIALSPLPHTMEQRAATELGVQSALAAQVCVLPPQQNVQVEVLIENVSAGHSYPSGAAQDRRTWIELTAYQGDKVIFQSGAVPAGGDPAELNDPHLALFGCSLADANGKEVHMFWQAATQQCNQLPQAVDKLTPHRVTQSYELPLSQGIPDHVTVTVFSQPIGQAVLQDLVKSGDLDPKIAAAVPTYTAINSFDWHASDGFGTCVPQGIFGP